MTDREMLELAAKACGMRPAEDTDEVWVDDGFGSVAGPFEWRDGEELVYHWNPFEDDGDAFRLAVRLEIEIRVFNGSAHAGKQEKFWCTERWFPDGNVFAATRLAILRAAAAIGSKS